MIWLALGQGEPETAALHAETARRLRPVGVRPEARSYHAHLTVGRVKRVSTALSGPMRQAVQGVEIPPHEWTVDRVVLYESRLSPSGATYRVVVQAILP